MKVKLLNIYIIYFCFLSITSIDVSTVEELHKALAKARAGQIILIASGIMIIMHMKIYINLN